MAYLCIHVNACVHHTSKNQNVVDSGVSEYMFQVFVFVCACLPMCDGTLRVCLCN